MQTITIEQAGGKDYRSNEAYKILRTNLQFCGNENKVIALTSCTPNEGKSNVSFNLAMSLAESGRKVIFLDADLRKSVLLGRYHINRAVKGMTHYLSGQNPIQEVVYATSIENLHMVFAGPVPPNPAELLGNRFFKELIEVLRKAYDYVVIDTPPLGSVIDSAIIAQESDGAILVVESGIISYKFAQKVKEQLDKSDCAVLGVILNKVNMEDNKYYGRYYGKYYGAYYGKTEKEETGETK